jgi:hypothetical protein
MTDTPSPNWPHPDALDALTAAADHHTLLLENDRVRVIETLIPSGGVTAVHTHRWPGALHILSWSDILRRDADGAVLYDSRRSADPPPNHQWSAPLPPHTLENVGERPFRAISVEVKD